MTWKFQMLMIRGASLRGSVSQNCCNGSILIDWFLWNELKIPRVKYSLLLLVVTSTYFYHFQPTLCLRDCWFSSKSDVRGLAIYALADDDVKIVKSLQVQNHQNWESLGHSSCRMKLEWNFLIFIFVQLLPTSSAHKGNIFICQMQLAGEILLANFCWQSFAGEVSGEVSEQVCSLGMRRNLRRRIGKIQLFFLL